MHRSLSDREFHVARWRASGLSRSAYCRTAGLSYHRFYGWTKSCADSRSVVESTAASAFIEVSRPAAAVAGFRAVVVSIQLSCGTTLHLHQQVDPAWIGLLAAAVRRC